MEALPRHNPAVRTGGDVRKDLTEWLVNGILQVHYICVSMETLWLAGLGAFYFH
jgi:hypothetical protein